MTAKLPLCRIFTDGSCYKPAEGDGIGGWCAVVAAPGWRKLLWGAEGDTTTNRCELHPIVAGVRYLLDRLEDPAAHRVEVYSDSEYTIRRLSDPAGDRAVDYRQFKGDRATLQSRNMHMWVELGGMAELFGSVRYIWVPRNSNYYNEFCDGMASSIYVSARNMMMSLYGTRYLVPSEAVSLDNPFPEA